MVIVCSFVEQVLQHVLNTIIMQQALVQIIHLTATRTINSACRIRSRPICHIKIGTFLWFHRFLDTKKLTCLTMLVGIVVEANATLIKQAKDECLVKILHTKLYTLDGIIARCLQNLHDGR